MWPATPYSPVFPPSRPPWPSSQASFLPSRPHPPTPYSLSSPPFALSSLQAALAKLPGELRAQQANAARVEARLQREKGAWVVGAGSMLPREFVQVRVVDVCPHVCAGWWEGSCCGGH